MTRQEACAAALTDDRPGVQLSVAGRGFAFHVCMGAAFHQTVTDADRREREVVRQADRLETLLDKQAVIERAWFVGTPEETIAWVQGGAE